MVVDTSLSMDRHLALARGVADDLCRHNGVALRVIDVDAAVQRDGLTTSGRRVAASGGGGTDMRIGIERATQRPRPSDSVVVVTDCDTPWPMRPPAAHLIVVAVGATDTSFAAVPKWATKIRAET